MLKEIYINLIITLKKILIKTFFIRIFFNLSFFLVKNLNANKILEQMLIYSK